MLLMCTGLTGVDGGRDQYRVGFRTRLRLLAADCKSHGLN